MEINAEMLLHGCCLAAFTLVLLLPVVLPGAVAAIAAAQVVCKAAWALKALLRLWRTRSLGCSVRAACRYFLTGLMSI